MADICNVLFKLLKIQTVGQCYTAQSIIITNLHISKCSVFLCDN